VQHVALLQSKKPQNRHLSNLNTIALWCI